MLSESHQLYETELFFLVLFAKAPKDHFIEFRALWDKKHRTTPPPDGKDTLVQAVQVAKLELAFDTYLADWIITQNRKMYDIYFGVCPREKMPMTPRGAARAASAEHVTKSVCAWIDYDGLIYQHLVNEEPKASILVATGHGAHGYFLYKEAMPIDKAIRDSESIRAKFRGDKCTDAPRVLRVPNTRNWKESDKIQMAKIEVMEPDRIFEGLNYEVPLRAKVFGDLPSDLRTLIMSGYDFAEERFRRDALKEDGSLDQSKLDFRAMLECMDWGINEEQIRQWWTDPNFGISAKYFEEGHNGPHYLEQTLKKVRAAHEKKAQQYPEIGEVINFETAEDLLNAPDLAFVVQSLLPVYGMMFVSGSAKAGKSLLVNDLALLLAGVPGKLLDRFQILKPGNVVYCQAEISRNSLKDRLNKIGASHGVKWWNFPIRFLNQNFNLGDMRHVMAMIKGLQKVKADYLIVDPFARFHRVSENKQSDMADILSNLSKIARESGVLGTIVVHHHGKPVEGAEREGVQMLRGHTLIGDWANSYITLSKRFNKFTQRKYVSILFELRDADEPPTMEFAINKETLRFEPYVEDDDRRLIVRDIVSQEELSPEQKVEEIRKRLKTNKNEARRLLAEEVHDRGNGKNGNGNVPTARSREIAHDEEEDDA